MKESSVSVGSKRRGEAVVLDGGTLEKRPRMVAECRLAWQCSGLLQELKKFPASDASSADESSRSKEALLVALGRCRYAGIILETQKKIKELLDNGEEPDSTMMKQEEETFNRRLLEERKRFLEEKEKIEAEIMTKKVELKKQRERDRNAARIALEKMEKIAARIELNVEIEKDLRTLSGFSLSTDYALHNLGLYVKDENFECEDV